MIDYIVGSSSTNWATNCVDRCFDHELHSN